jgi:hypothetical protein
MRLLVCRLVTHVQHKLHEGQHCCARNNNILDAASSIHDTCGANPPCDLPLFTQICLNFVCVSYDCIHYTLRQYGLHDDTVDLFKGLWAHASSPCQIYVQMSAAFRIWNLVTQIAHQVRSGTPTFLTLYLRRSTKHCLVSGSILKQRM